MSKTNGNGTEVEKALERINTPPETGVFGQLQVQMKSMLSEVAIERMDLLTELVQTERETNKIIRDKWIPAAQRRKAHYENLGIQQGFVESKEGDTEPVEKQG
jgi:hypothetical protein